jgi:hypothetical protein
MKRKQAIRPIRRHSTAEARPLEAAAAARRPYPDARTLAAAMRDAAVRAARVIAIPAVGLVAGCAADAPTPLPIAPLPPVVEIGKVVEGLKPPLPETRLVPSEPSLVPIETPPGVPHVVPVRPHEVPPRPGGDMPAVDPGFEAQPPPPCPLPQVHPNPPPLRGRVSNVRPHPVPVPGGIRPASPITQADPIPAPSPVPRTLSDEALRAALASIR